MTPRIAYLRPGPFPLTNTSLEQVLRQAFPEYAVDVFDVFPALRRQPGVLLASLWHAVRFYGPDLAAGRKPLRLAMWRTPYIFHAIRRWVAEHTPAGRYQFSFQIQSLFDGSLPGRPHYVYTDHTHLANRGYPGFTNGQLYAPAWIELEKSIYHSAALNFVRSTNVARSLVEDYACPPDRTACVYAGANVAVPDPGRAAGAPLDRYRAQHILFVGVDWERKGGPDLAAAFRLILSEHPEARLTIVGCRPGLNLPNCEEVGRVPAEAVAPYFARASVFCMPTRLEPFGIVYVEALAHGLPIVATRVGAVPDMVEDHHNGFLVAPGDVPGLARALSQLLASPELGARFGAAGRQLARERYTWPAVGDRLRQHILSAKSAGPH